MGGRPPCSSHAPFVSVVPVTRDELARRLDGSVADDVQLLVLHGSRARGDATPQSDWDLGYIAEPSADIGTLMTVITLAIGTDLVDLVDLTSASALLRYRTARDGVALVESEPGMFLHFRLEATQFWCDVEWVVRAAHRDLLAALG